MNKPKKGMQTDAEKSYCTDFLWKNIFGENKTLQLHEAADEEN